MRKSFKISAADGNKVVARHYINGGDRLLIAAHGIDSEKTEGGLYEDLIAAMPSYDGLLFDFRGHGQSRLSSSHATVSGELLDLMAVFKWARAQGYREIDHVASSFGASITILAVAAYEIDFLRKVVFWNPVVDYQKTFTRPISEWGKSFFNQTQTIELADRKYTKIFDSHFKISALMTQELLIIKPQMMPWPPNIPLTIFHGDSDTAVPASAARDYAKRNHVPIKLIRGVDHGFDSKVADVIRMTGAWLRE